MEAKMETQDLNQIVAQTDATLIASNKVQGVGVYRSTGERIGTVKHIMINKRTGQVAYAVMNFGGFLGMGEEGYPIAWSSLTFQEQPDGYVVNLTDEQLGQGRDASIDLKAKLEATVVDTSPSI
jgi:sporulation protein YlmC with PRC-barrel domain